MNKNKAILSLIGVFGLVLATAFTSYFATVIPIKQVGPYYASSTAFDSTNSGQVGGVVKTYLAGDSERVGNVVYVSAKNTVSRSATIANYNAIAGVIVGGARTSMQAALSLSDTSTLAGIAGQKVLVLERGRAYVLIDDQTGFAPGLQVIASASVSGRIRTRTTAIDTFFRVLGKTIDTAVTGKAVLVDVRAR